MTKSARLKALLESGYFPDELPPPFNSNEFATYRRVIGKAWESIHNYPHYPKSVAERFSVPKVTDWRRELAIVNPVAQFHVAKLIADNWPEIKNHLGSCSFGVESVSIESGAARAVSIPDFRLVALRHAEISALHNHALIADISRFYGTLYTHAIPWGLHSKRWSKAHLNDAVYHASLGARLDKAVRKGQDNQTIGIPVGPDTSRIIAEIVAVAMDAVIQAELKLGADSIVRNVDDWYIGFDNAGEAEEAIAVLSTAARDYELEIHPEKTKVVKISSEVQPVWPTALRQHVISSDWATQSRSIDHYFALAFQHASEAKGQNVLRYALKLISRVEIIKSNWHQFETYLLKAVRANATTIPAAVNLFALFGAQAFPVNKPRVAKLIKDIIATCGPMGSHFEIAWALFLAKMLRIKLPAAWVTAVTKLESSVCGLLLLDLRQMDLIDGEIDISLWAQSMTQTGLNSNMWMLAYEAYRKSWLAPALPGFIESHPYFAELAKRDISFYDENRGVKNVRRTTPQKPSDAFQKHMAAIRSQEFPEDLQDLMEEWDLPDGADYGGY